MKIVVIDGQGGRMGSLLIERLKRERTADEIYAIGTNSIATAAMLRAGASVGATGENPVLVACRDADWIVGPVGIVLADSLAGEVTAAMAAAVGQSRAKKMLLPVSRCRTYVAGVKEMPLNELVDCAVRMLRGGTEEKL